MSAPSHGDRTSCRWCCTAIEYVVYSQATGSGTVEVLDAWWAHAVHPADNHDAEPLPVADHADDERVFRGALDVLAAGMPPRRRWWWRR